MLATLRYVASLLSRDDVDADQLAEQLGIVTEAYPSNLLVVPRYDEFSQANVVRELDPVTLEHTAAPSYVELLPKSPPSLLDLARTFGRYDSVPARAKLPPRAVFHLTMPDEPYAVTLIVSLAEGRATSIVLRRDLRL